MKIDIFRYMIVYVYGGVYSDIDTYCLKSIENWFEGHEGVSAIIGIEVDAHTVADYSKYWRRPLLFCQVEIF